MDPCFWRLHMSLNLRWSISECDDAASSGVRCGDSASGSQHKGEKGLKVKRSNRSSCFHIVGTGKSMWP